jgi:thiol-disulfide isomerase/thioredoxin
VALKESLRRLNPFVIAAIAAVTASACAIVIIGSFQQDSNKTDVVLDQPGVYQEPGIGTNAPVVGKQLEHADVLDLNDESLNTSTLFTDGKPALINYWFSNCQPCKREMPALQAAFAQYGEQVNFVGINTQDSPEIASSFVQDIGVAYRILRDPNGKSVVANGVSTFPTTFFVNAAGTIIKQIAGELTADDITAALKELGVQ